MKRYRLRIALEDDVAEVLEGQKDKAAYVERAVEWYARFGEECLQKLDQVIRLLSSSGSLPPLGVTTVEKREDIEDAFAGFEV